MSRKLQSPAIPRSNKSGKEGKRLALLGRELQVKLKEKANVQWKQGQVTWKQEIV